MDVQLTTITPVDNYVDSCRNKCIVYSHDLWITVYNFLAEKLINDLISAFNDFIL